MASPPPLQVILKVASRCNLNCTYCYVYNKGDSSWKERPTRMGEPVFEAAVKRTLEHCKRSGQDSVRITFHGGEPLLVGHAQFDAWCQAVREAMDGTCAVHLSLQTNGTLIDEQWIDLFLRHDVSVGVSLDGPAAINDAARVDHAGRGSYDRVARGLRMLRDADVAFQVLCVIQFGVDSREIHRHLVGLGVKRINYLLPDFTHDSIAPVRAQYGPTPCADALLPILEAWWAEGSLDVRIGLFWNMARVILGGDSHIDVLGGLSRYQYVFVETGGEIEGLDVLRICGPGLTSTGLNVLRDNFETIFDTSPLHRSVIFEGVPLPTGCSACPERVTCGGGYLPHRFSRQRDFDNPTVWCADMLRLFGRMRQLLQVTPQETVARRDVLFEMATS